MKFTVLAALLPLLGLASAAPATLNKRYSGVQIVSKSGKCLAAAPKTGVGSQVTTADCGSAWALYWDINPGSGSVLLHGSNLALDAGSTPANNGALKVWTSYPGLFQQTWYLTGDNRIAITGGDQCLDEGPNGAQTYKCTTGNTNQVWTIRDTGAFPTTTTLSITTASSTVSSTVSSATTTSAPASPTIIYSNTQIVSGRTGKCLGAAPKTGSGSQVTTVACDSFWALYWDIHTGSGSVLLHGTQLALDAGSSPANNGPLKVWTSYPGLYQQTWYLTPDNRIAITGGDQCLDDDGTNAQTYKCTPGNTNQIWYPRNTGSDPTTTFTGSSTVVATSTA